MHVVSHLGEFTLIYYAYLCFAYCDVGQDMHIFTGPLFVYVINVLKCILLLHNLTNPVSTDLS